MRSNPIGDVQVPCRLKRQVPACILRRSTSPARVTNEEDNV